MRITDRVEQIVIETIDAYRALVGAEVDHQVQIIHQVQPGAAPQPMLWICLSVRSLALGEWLLHDAIITPDLHPGPDQLTVVVATALKNLAAARAQQAAPTRSPAAGGARLPTSLPLPPL